MTRGSLEVKNDIKRPKKTPNSPDLPDHLLLKPWLRLDCVLGKLMPASARVEEKIPVKVLRTEISCPSSSDFT